MKTALSVLSLVALLAAGAVAITFVMRASSPERPCDGTPGPSCYIAPMQLPSR